MRVRGTPSALAVVGALTPSGFIYSSHRISPGWIGLAGSGARPSAAAASARRSDRLTAASAMRWRRCSARRSGVGPAGRLADAPERPVRKSANFDMERTAPAEDHGYIQPKRTAVTLVVQR